MNDALARMRAAAEMIAPPPGVDIGALIAAAPTVLDQVRRFGARINLVGDPSPAAVVDEHLVESVALAALVARHGPPPARFVDVGAGAGLETLALLLLWPGAEAVAVEPRGKRATFLELAADAAGVGRRLRVARARVGEVDVAALGAPFALATSRATFAPPRWLELAADLVDVGGVAAAHIGVDAVDAGPGWSMLGDAGVPRRPAHRVACWRRNAP